MASVGLDDRRGCATRLCEVLSESHSLTPDAHAPDLLAPEVLAADVLAPATRTRASSTCATRTAPEVLAPEVLAPEVLAPDILASDVLAPNVLAPEVLALGVLSPDHSRSRQVAGEAVAAHTKLVRVACDPHLVQSHVHEKLLNGYEASS